MSKKTKEKELQLERRKCWIIWVILKSNKQSLRAICLSEEVAKEYESYIKKLPGVVNVFVEKTMTDHLYFGMFEYGMRTQDEIKKAMAAARAAYSEERSRKRA